MVWFQIKFFSVLYLVALLMMLVYCFIIASPHFLFGSGKTAMSFVEGHVTDGLLGVNDTTTVSEFAYSSKLCGATAQPADGPKEDSNIWIIFFVAHLLCGVADSIFWCLLLAYLDNNVSKAEAPIFQSEGG